MHLVNYLNRTITDSFSPFFEVIHAIEAFLLIVFIFIALPIMRATWITTYYHLNIRLRTIFSLSFAVLFVSSRLVVIWHQYFGSAADESISIIIASATRESFITHATTIAWMLAIDRWIAMKAWDGYESGSLLTIIVLLLLEFILSCYAWTFAILFIFEMVSIPIKLFVHAFMSVIGRLFLVYVYRLNKREMRKLKKSPRVHSYSVRRCYQLKENLEIIIVLYNIALPLTLCSVPALLLYAAYEFTPPSFYTIRYVSISLYDLWIAVTCLVILLCLLIYEPRVLRNLGWNWRPKNVVRDSIPIAELYKADADVYFDLLSKDLKLDVNAVRRFSRIQSGQHECAL